MYKYEKNYLSLDIIYNPAILEVIRTPKLSREEAFSVCISWLMHINYRIIVSNKHEYVLADQKPNNADNSNAITQQIEFKIIQHSDSVWIHIEILPPNTRLHRISQIEIRRLINNFRNYLEQAQAQVGQVDLDDGDENKVDLITNIVNAFRNLYTSRPPLFSKSDIVYEELPPPPVAESRKLILIAILLFSTFYIVNFRSQPMYLLSNILFFLATYGVAFLFLYWVYKSDKYEKEPWIMVILVFAWGVFSGLIAGPLNQTFGPYFRVYGNEALVAAFVEEPVKAIGLYFLLSHKKYGKEFNTPLDGIVYGFAVGIGFFAMENFMYFLVHGASNLVIRSLFCWGHGVYGVTVGLWLAVAKCMRGRIKAVDLIPGLLVAISLHFLWNGWDSWIGKYSGDILYYQALLQLVYLRKIIREGLRDEVLWGYSIGKSPG